MHDIPDGSIDMVLCDLPYEKTRGKWDVKIDIENYESIISSTLTLLGGAISHISFLEWILMSILLESTPMIKREMKDILSIICLHKGEIEW